jgi:hypothetical protein
MFNEELRMARGFARAMLAGIAIYMVAAAGCLAWWWL